MVYYDVVCLGFEPFDLIVVVLRIVVISIQLVYIVPALRFSDTVTYYLNFLTNCSSNPSLAHW